jgi:hypothetical protein
MSMRGLRERPKQQTGDTPQKSRRLLTPKRLAGTIVISAAGLLLWGYHYMQSPAEGTVRTRRSAPQIAGVSANTITGKSFSLTLPGEYAAVKVDPARSPTLEQVAYRHASALESRRISITIKSSPPAFLREESALLFRQRSNEYESNNLTVAEAQATQMTKKDGTEITYFIPGKKAYAIIATTSSNPRDSYIHEVDEIVKSFKWN